MMMAISVMAVAIAVAAVTVYLIYDMHKSKAQSVALLAHIAGDTNSAALAFQSKDNIQTNLEIYRSSPFIRAVCIYNEAGELFGEYEANIKQAFCLNKFTLLPDTLKDLITVKDEIRHSDALLGHIYVVSDTSDIESYVRRITQVSSIVTAFTLAFIILVALYFSRTLSGAIMELTTTIQSITGSGNYELKAKTHYSDEIGILAKAFNNMLGEVLRRDKDLADANERLEEKIEIRTHELLAAKKKAEAANEAKTEFLRNMSHEFRTPLHAILSFSSYGVSEYITAKREELKKYFEYINKGSERLGKLVNEVLDLAKMENGTQVFSMQYADLRELANRAYEPVASLMKDKDITLHIRHDEQEVGVNCDPDKIIQVITNLLSNAIKFTPPGHSITLKTQILNNMSTLSIIDEGIGIPEEEKEAIFESFRQSSRTNTGSGGTGLGLAICRNIINAHEGTIWAENNSNALGAKVTFALQSVPGAPGAQPQGVSYDQSYQN